MSKDHPNTKTGNIGKITIFVCCALLLLTVGIIALIYSTEPTAQQVTATKRTAMLVEVVSAKYGTFRPRISALGTVQSKDDVMLSPQISGQVIERSPAFEAGSFVEKGTVLLRINPADYENTIAQRKSALHQAQANLEVEKGRQRVAKMDLQLLENEISSNDQALILREPQLNVAQADVEAAQAALEQAKLELARTEIVAPFDAQVISRNVSPGSQVSPGDELGRLVGTSEYQIIATVSTEKIQFIGIARNGTREGSKVLLRDRAAGPNTPPRIGIVNHMIGALDETTRLARLIIDVSDPLSQSSENADKPALMLGSILQASIEGKPIENVVRIARSYLREDDTVWVNDNNQLKIVPVTVVFRDAERVYISEGLEGGDQIVTTSLSSVVEGAALRTSGESESSDT